MPSQAQSPRSERSCGPDAAAPARRSPGGPGNEANRAQLEQKLAAARNSPSRPLPHRARLESSFGADLGGVLAHYDDEDTKALLGTAGVPAACEGAHVWFAEANPSLEVAAHEVAHARQAAESETPKGTSAEAELDADAAADAAAKGESAQVGVSTAGGAAGWGLSDLFDSVADAGNGLYQAAVGLGDAAVEVAHTAYDYGADLGNAAVTAGTATLDVVSEVASDTLDIVGDIGTATLDLGGAVVQAAPAVVSGVVDIALAWQQSPVSGGLEAVEQAMNAWAWTGATSADVSADLNAIVDKSWSAGTDAMFATATLLEHAAEEGKDATLTAAQQVLSTTGHYIANDLGEVPGLPEAVLLIAEAFDDLYVEPFNDTFLNPGVAAENWLEQHYTDPAFVNGSTGGPTMLVFLGVGSTDADAQNVGVVVSEQTGLDVVVIHDPYDGEVLDVIQTWDAMNEEAHESVATLQGSDHIVNVLLGGGDVPIEAHSKGTVDALDSVELARLELIRIGEERGEDPADEWAEALLHDHVSMVFFGAAASPSEVPDYMEQPTWILKEDDLVPSFTSEGQTYEFGDGVGPHTLSGEAGEGYIPENEAAVDQMLKGLEGGDEGVCTAEP